jgi:hypothetical protein
MVEDSEKTDGGRGKAHEDDYEKVAEALALRDNPKLRESLTGLQRWLRRTRPLHW